MLLRIPTQSIGGACQGDRLTSEGESSHAEGDAAVPGLHHEHFKELTKSPSNEEASEAELQLVDGRSRSNFIEK